MGNVVNLVQPLDEMIIIEAFREIASSKTDAVVIITSEPGYVGVRLFGPRDKCVSAIDAIREMD